MANSKSILFLLLLVVPGSCVDHNAAPIILPLEDKPGLELAVRLQVHGRSGWFMFDTGASVHTFASSFVSAAGMTVDDSSMAGVQARDATGAPVTFRTVHGETARLPDGRSLVLGSAIVVDFPPEIDQAEIGGLLSPQLLAGAGQAVVLDLRVPELRIEPLDDAVRRLHARLLTSDQVKVCRDATAPIQNQVYAVRVTVGENSGWLKLDTGARRTAIGAGSALVRGLQLETAGEAMGLAGKRQKVSVARNLALSFADSHATVDAQVAEMHPDTCGADGLLGRDALRRCALVLTGESLAIICGQ